MRSILRSFRHAVRRLLRAPGFTAGALLTLALGIGATTALFSVVNGVVLRGFPLPDDEELVSLRRAGDTEADLSLPDAVDLRAETRTLSHLGAYMPFWALDLTGEGDPERVVGTLVEPAYLRTLGVTPVAGRPLTEADAVPGAERVGLLEEGFWRRRFGGDPEVLGRRITLSGRPLTVVGVLPGTADPLEAGTEIWLPFAAELPDALSGRGMNNLEAVGRLAPGVSAERASRELRALTGRLAAAYPTTNQGKILEAVRLRDRLVGDVRPGLLVLLGAVGLVLLIACANLAGLLLVRATRRARTVAVRRALGAGAWDVASVALSESLLLALAGGALGAGLGVWGTELLLALVPEGLPRSGSVHVDGTALAFALAASLATGLFFGAAPALQALRRDPARLLGSGARTVSSRGDRRFLGGLVVGEVALAFVLLIGSGLLVRSFLGLRAVDLGFEPAGVVTANLVLPESRYGEPAAQTAAFERMLEAIEARPGIEEAGFVIGAPLAGFGAIGYSLRFDDRPPPAEGDRPSSRVRPVLGDYFRTLGVRIVRGRTFSEVDDAESEPVAIVNESFAAQYWPGEDPVGKRVASLFADEPLWMTVVGVAGDVKQTSLDGGDQDAIYVPYAQRQMTWGRFGTLAARGRGEPGTLVEAVRRAVWSVDPALPIDAVQPLGDLVDGALAAQRFRALLVGLFSVVALLIAIQGLYGVLSYSIAQRRGEIGVRMALGARRGDILRLVLRRGLALTGTGLALGAAAALGLTRLLGGLLFGVTATDPPTWVAVGMALAVAAALACLVPARRAGRVDPARTLRWE